MVGYRGTLWTVYDDFQVNRYARPYNAVGAGCDFALGAMTALKNLSPEKRIHRALEIASDLSSTTRPPFVIRSTGEIA
jgi:ATP-dependent protease HslVU (ClpYQ) peptidase subunit